MVAEHDQTTAPRGKRRWTWALKIAGLVVFVALFLRRPEMVGAALSGIARTNLLWFLASLATLLATLVFAAIRTRFILRCNRASVPLRHLYVDLVVATGLNAVILIGVGVLYRAKRINDVLGAPARSVAIVGLDRLVGLAGIGAGGLLAFVLIGAGDLDVGWRRPLLSVGALVAIVGVAALVFPAKARALLRQIQPVVGSIASVRAVAVLVLVSTVIFAATALQVYCLARGLGLDVGYEVFLYATPLVTIATVLPVSIGGVGVRELGYIFFLAPLGVENGHAVALGISQYGVFLATAAVGALLHWSTKGGRLSR